MNTEDELLRKRLSELANKSYNNNQYLFTGFLSMFELDVFYRMERELSFVTVTAFGGTNDCERVMLRFGDEELCGYVEPFPIVCIEIIPLVEKFAQELSHRDYLGALMNLGIERSTLGDIIIDKKRAFLFCNEKMAAYIIENVDKIRHNNVRCEIVQSVPESTIVNLEQKNIQVSAARTDSIISKVYNLSRSESVELFRAKKVFVNGRLNENNSGQLKNGDKVSVRGYGKFKYNGVMNETKKGKLNVSVEIYV